MSMGAATVQTSADVSASSDAWRADFGAGVCIRHIRRICDSVGVSVPRSDYAHGRVCINRCADTEGVWVVAICIGVYTSALPCAVRCPLVKAVGERERGETHV